MTRTIWNLIGTVAIVNLIAVAGSVAWLLGTGRIDRERWEAVRAIISEPVAPRSEPELVAPEEEGSIVATSIRIDAQARQDRQTAMAVRRLHDETVQLGRSLEEQRRELEIREATLAAERAAWESATRSERDGRVIAQFRKTVRLLESVPPKQAKELLLERVRDGGIEGAVAYLDAMTPYKASGVLKAFKGEEETRVAAELLERLRRRTPSAASAGIDAAGATDHGSSSARPSAQPTRPIANGGASLDSGG